MTTAGLQARPASPAVLGYGVGSFGTGLFSTVPTVLLLFYCTEVLRLPPSGVAMLILAPKIWSILWDPYVGSWSDGSRSRFGRRMPFMLIGAAGMAAAFVALFAGPAVGQALTFIWVGAAYIAFVTFYSLFAVPYTAVPADRGSVATTARLISARMAFVMTGILAGAVAAPLLVAWGGEGRAGYRVMASVLSAVCLVTMLAAVLSVSRGDRRDPGAGTAPGLAQALHDLSAVVGNAPFRRLSLAFLAQASAYGATSAALPYLVTLGFGRSTADVGTAFGALLAASIVAVPLWTRIARSMGLANGIALAALGYGAAIAAIGLAVLAGLPWSVALVVLALAGAPFAGLQVLTFTLAAELVRASAPDAEARFAGAWTATEKLGLALGPALLAFVLDLAGRGNAALAGFLLIVPPTLCVLASALLRNKELQS